MSGHQKIRFRRGEIVGLDSLPSAGRKGLSLHGAGRIVGYVTAVLTAALIALVVALFAKGSLVVTSPRLLAEAERAASTLFGPDVSLETGEVRVTFGLSGPFGVSLRDVSATDSGTGELRLRAGEMQFGIRLLPLLGGHVRLSDASLREAHLSLAELPAAPGGGFLAKLSGEDGMLGADEVVPAVFAGLRSAVAALDGSGSGRFEVENVGIELGSGMHLAIGRAALSERPSGDVGLELEAELGGRPLSAAATIRSTSRQELEFDLSLDMPLRLPQPGDDPAFAVGALTATLSGQERGGPQGGRISASVEMTRTRIRVGGSPSHEGRIAFDLSLDAARPNYDVRRLEVGDGRTDLRLSGVFGPASGEDRPHYFYQLASGASLVFPVDSSEPGLPVALLVTGKVNSDLRRILAERLVVATGESEVLASGALDLPEGGGSGLTLAVNVSNLPTGHAKNLWPWFAAAAARDWTLKNVYGGIVRKGSLKIDLPPGRTGSGVPLSAENLLGHFEVHGARFDMAGSIPPMRDAVGLVDFAGTDVEIGLVSGTVFTENGRTLAARNGSFRIDTHEAPLAGQLALDVEGSADAVAEIANYEPISISRYLKLDPEGMSGNVSGKVTARIPLAAGATQETLDWSVDLAYTGLNVPQAFEGQRLGNAEGTVYADPTRAMIEASGELNGVPAVFSLEEPLGKDKSGRRMIAELQLDDRTREQMMPGLGPLVSGPFSVTLISRGDGSSDISADLTRTKLSVPWVGWEKSPGQSASASFVMKTTDKGTEITEFSASGRDFLAEGGLVLDRRGLQRADFKHFALRPGDDFAALIERRQAGGYSATIRGRSADVRTVVSQFNLDSRDGDGGWGATDDFSLDLELASATGHHGEVLRDLKLVFSGPGTTVGGMRGSARTASGGAVSITDATIGRERRLELAAGNAGEVLRFLNIYQNVRGGTAELRLSGQVGRALSGPLIARNFDLIEEQRLDSVVNRPAPGSQRSLNDAVDQGVDAARAQFEVAYAVIEKGTGYLNIADGVVRGSSIGATFQGTVFDRSGNMLVTGTFMPAYGLNRLFGEIPLLGVVLGNGRDRGLIGITFRLHGRANDPQISVNPLSLIAPGIFRKIFEYQPRQMDTGDTE